MTVDELVVELQRWQASGHGLARVWVQVDILPAGFHHAQLQSIEADDFASVALIGEA